MYKHNNSTRGGTPRGSTVGLLDNMVISEPPKYLFHSGFGDRSWLKKHGKKDLIVFNDEALLELRKYFNSLDERGTGSIGVDYLEDPFIALGLSQTREEVQYLIDSVDEDGSGKIEFDEFLSIMSKIRKGGNSKNEKSAIYDFFQKMSSGNLGEDMDKSLPFRLNVSQYRRRKILESIMADDKNKKEKGNRILQAFKRQISLNPNLRDVSMDAKRLVSTTGGLTMYNRKLVSKNTKGVTREL